MSSNWSNAGPRAPISAAASSRSIDRPSAARCSARRTNASLMSPSNVAASLDDPHVRSLDPRTDIADRAPGSPTCCRCDLRPPPADRTRGRSGHARGWRHADRGPGRRHRRRALPDRRTRTGPGDRRGGHRDRQRRRRRHHARPAHLPGSGQCDVYPGRRRRHRARLGPHRRNLGGQGRAGRNTAPSRPGSGSATRTSPRTWSAPGCSPPAIR